MRIALILAAVALLSIPSHAHGADLPVGDVELELKLDRGADSGKIKNEPLATTITIESARGIGGATIVRRSQQWPAKLTLHIGISPLEGFSARCGDRQLAGSLGFNQKKFEDKVPIHKLLDNGRAGSVEQQVPLKITKVGNSVVVELPAELLHAQQSKLHLHWIDAYRN